MAFDHFKKHIPKPDKSQINHLLTLSRNSVTQAHNPKCTVNNCFYETHSVQTF